MFVEDPLIGEDSELQVMDLASAKYALKIASDNYYAVIRMREQMEREMARSEKETLNQGLDLIRPYIEQDTEHPTPLRAIPNPMPDTVPAEIQAVIKDMYRQLDLEKQRANADFLANADPLTLIAQECERKFKTWFKREVQKRALWLNGSNRAVLSGCTVTYQGGDNFNLQYTELDYD